MKSAARCAWLSVVTFDDSSTITYTYDAGDRITVIDDAVNGIITRTYDDLDRLTEEVTAEGTVDYTYDNAGRRSLMTVAGQTAVSYDYDDANRLTGITQDTASVAITYDSANRRSTLTYPNGIVATYGYDNANQLTGLNYVLGMTTLGDLTYTYDASGRRTSLGGSWARTGIPAALTSATYNAGNQLTAWDTTSFTHDLNGNLTADGTTTYSWNARNQLTGLSGGASASLAYDGSARRRSKTIRGTTTRFLYDGVNFVQELSSGGTPTANLLTGLGFDETLTRTDGSGARSLLVDALGSTLELADGSGTLQTHYTFDPFGTATSSGATSSNAPQFTGRENDGNGLFYYRGRFYSPQLQRFISEDPLGESAGPDLYSYVANAPLDFIDPLGLKPSPRFGNPPLRKVPSIGAPPPRREPHIGVDPRAPHKEPRIGPASPCNALCQLARDIGQRTAPMANPWTYPEILGISALGGVGINVAVDSGAGAAAVRAVNDLLLAAADAATDTSILLKTRFNVDVGDVLQGMPSATGMPPPSWGGAIGSAIGNLLGF